jgi:hypothetical protein
MLHQVSRGLRVAAAALPLLVSSTASAQTAYFDDPTDVIQVDGQTSFSGSSTYEAVVLFPGDSARTGFIFNEWAAFQEDKQFSAGPTTLSGYQYSGGGLLHAGVTMTPWVWHHLAFVADGSGGRLYVDGILVASGSAGAGFGGAGKPHLGAIFRDGGINPSFVGYLQSFRVSDVARYTEDWFAPPLGDLPSDANTLLLFNFDEPAGSPTVTDSGPQGLVGALGTAFDGATSPKLGVLPTQTDCGTAGVGWDLWNGTRGAQVTGASGFLSGNDTQGPDMFGAADSSPEPGITLFRDDESMGFDHWVEWEVPAAVTIRSLHLRAGHDWPGTSRSFDRFRLLAYDDQAGSFELLSETEHAVPYGGGSVGNEISLCINVPERTATRFRAEFRQATGGAWPGPRIYELDGFTTPIPALSVAVEEAVPQPGLFLLGAPYPNPFRTSAAWPFDLDRPGRVRITVHDVLGRELAVLVDGERPAGRHEALLTAAGLAGGVYLVRMETGSSAGTRTVTLIR